MLAKLSTKEKIGRVILGIGAVGFFLGLAGSLAMNSIYLKEPHAPTQSTGNVVQWNSHYDVRYITRRESRWSDIDEGVTFCMFGLVALGAYLTRENSKK
jgi:hypothetical protein